MYSIDKSIISSAESSPNIDKYAFCGESKKEF
jgi:hypothetical protein